MAVISLAQGEGEHATIGDIGEVSSGGYDLGPLKDIDGDAGEVSQGSYGETSIIFSSGSSSGMSRSYSAYPSNPYRDAKPSFQTATQVVPAQVTATTSVAPAVQLYQPPQAADQQLALAYNILANQPSMVYYNMVMYPWQTFVSTFPKNMPMFWVNTQAGWQWYATCPLGGWAQEIMFIPQTGALGVYEVYPDRTVKFYNLGFVTPGYHYLWFNGDTPGRHTTIVTVDRLPSNAVVIDVI